MKLVLPILLAVLAFLVAPAHATHNQYNPYPPAQPRDACGGRVGEPCELPEGFRRRGCGGSVVLSEEVVELDVIRNGPNVCRFTQEIFTHELEYAYACYRDWAFDYYYRTYYLQNRLICQETPRCDLTRNQTFTRHTVNCCPGFATRPHDHKANQDYYFYLYYTPIAAIPVGCPVAVADTLLECLTRQGLNDFAAFVNTSSFVDLFTTNETQDITVFAPTGEAFMEVGATRLMAVDVDLLVGNHIVNSSFTTEAALHRMKSLDAFSGLRLFVTTVQRRDTRHITYNPRYGHQPNHRILTDSFINGASIINEDACRTPTGTLNIIDQVLMPSNTTILELLMEAGTFTMFLTALQAVGLDEYLMNRESVRTVFAVPDDQFSEQIPEMLFDCITVYMRQPLNDLLLRHIVVGAEYTSTLALVSHVYTLQRYVRVMVDRNENRTIRLGENHDTTVTMADIQALNGVVHVVDSFIIPTGFTFGKCQEFAPTTPPPTTPPTTMPTTAMPTNSTNGTGMEVIG